MRVERLQEEDILEILKLYEEHCGMGRDIMVMIRASTADVLAQVRDTYQKEWRAGSRWKSHSKLKIFTTRDYEVDVDFISNFFPHEHGSPAHQEAETAGSNFRRSVQEYLASKQET
jgi:hypothetical protein